MKICSRGHRRHGRHSHEGAAEDRRRRGGVDRQPHRREREGVRRRMEDSVSLDESRGVHRSSRRRRRDPHDAERAARGPDACSRCRKASTSRSRFRWPEPARLRAHAGGGEEGRARSAWSRTRAASRRRIARSSAASRKARFTCITWWSRPISSGATNLNMHGQPRSWVDNLLWHHGCHSVDHRAVAPGRAELGRLGPEGTGPPGARHPDGPDRRHEIEGGAALQHGDVVQQQGTVRRVLPLHRRRGHLQGVSRLDDRQRGQGSAARPACPRSIGRTSSSSARSARDASRNRARPAACRRWRCSIGSTRRWAVRQIGRWAGGEALTCHLIDLNP